jgi:hypothetical protein
LAIRRSGFSIKASNAKISEACVRNDDEIGLPVGQVVMLGKNVVAKFGPALAFTSFEISGQGTA